MDTSGASVPDAENPNFERRLACPVARLRSAVDAIGGEEGTTGVRDAAVELVRLARQRSTATHRRPSDHEGRNIVASLRLAAQALQRHRSRLDADDREALVGILGRGIRRIHELGRAETGRSTFDRAALAQAARARPEITLVSAGDIPTGTVVSGDLREVREVMRALRRALGGPPVVRVVARADSVGLRVGADGRPGHPPRWIVELPPAYPDDMTVTLEIWPQAPDGSERGSGVQATVWLPVVAASDGD